MSRYKLFQVTPEGRRLRLIRDLLEAETKAQQMNKALLRRPHTDEAPRMMQQVMTRALRITVLLNLWHEGLGSPVRHATVKWGENLPRLCRPLLEVRLATATGWPGWAREEIPITPDRPPTAG